jgi:eukaryotic-like serine/threonine-protein kinase
MVEDSASLFPSPKHFGRYEVVRRLGRGAMGVVFEVRHEALGTRAAVKVLDCTDATAVRRILREGRAAAAIRHPHVVTVLDVGTEGDRPYLVMELLEGEDLRERLSRVAPLSVAKTVDWMLPIVSAVAAAHDAGVVHRDLKPSNVLLARRRGGEEPVVVDFGISKQMDDSAGIATSSQGIPGTVQYMAPEQLRGLQIATPLSDQYALGVLLYECLTGGTPFCSEDQYELMHAIMTAPVVAPRALNPNVSEALDRIVLRAIARDSITRFPSVRALGAALLPFATEEARKKWMPEMAALSEASGGFAVPPPTPPRLSRGGPTGHWVGRLASAGVLVALIVVLLASLLQAKAEHPPSELTKKAPPLQTVEQQPLAPSAHEATESLETVAPLLPSARWIEQHPPRGTSVGAPQRAERGAAPRRVTTIAGPSSSAPSDEGSQPSIERGTHNIPIVE